MERKSGVLMHISSLFSDYSTGNFSFDNAKYFIDFLKDCGFSYWQVLPFCTVDDANSPYKSFSAFGGNPYFIDIEKLYSDGLITKDELTSQKQENCYLCEYERLKASRMELLKKAAMRITDRKEIEDFVEKDIYLYKFCEFMALRRKNNNLPHTEWTDSEYEQDEMFMWEFIQYEFFSQWKRIKDYANSNGIRIIGDIPIYVSPDSTDVWSNPELFELDQNSKPVNVAGVPPDYFCPDGQLWGNPLYNWELMKKSSYKWWKDRISHTLEIFDGVRIDHFRAIESYYSVDADAKDAKNGVWKKGPGADFLTEIKKVCKSKLIIAEDLGVITKEVEDLRDKFGLPGMRVFQFAFMSYENPHLPHNYINNCVAYSGTHDNNTLLGYLWETGESVRKELLNYCSLQNDDWDRYGCEAIIRTLLQSAAGLVIFPIQDILGYGSDTRLNIPGSTDGNWKYRITREQLDLIDRNKYMYFNRLYRRN